MTQSELLDRLESDLREVLDTVRTQLLPLNEHLLRQRPDNDPKRWNALECCDHLNRSYADYLAVIELSLHRAKARRQLHDPTAEIRYNWVGREALRWVTVTNNKRFKTSKRYNPTGKEVAATAARTFVINAERLLRLVQLSREVDLNRARVRFALFSPIKYRLGNLLEFMVVHAQRHVGQALRAAEK